MYCTFPISCLKLQAFQALKLTFLLKQKHSVFLSVVETIGIPNGGQILKQCFVKDHPPTKKQPKTHLPSLKNHKILIFEKVPTKTPWKLTATLMLLKLGYPISFQVHLLVSFREAQITWKSLTWLAPQHMGYLKKEIPNLRTIIFGIHSSTPPKTDMTIAWKSPILNRRYIDSFPVGLFHLVMLVLEGLILPNCHRNIPTLAVNCAHGRRNEFAMVSFGGRQTHFNFPTFPKLPPQKSPGPRTTQAFPAPDPGTTPLLP